jgi:hypothetical protein
MDGRLDNEDIYDLVVDGVRQALQEFAGGDDVSIDRRMLGGKVIFEDDEGRVCKEIPVGSLFKKVTSVREKLRVLEQKINNNGNLDAVDKAEFQAVLSRCYGSMTTFNFLFAEPADSFQGTGGR